MKKAQHKESNSLKTFYLYTAIVLGVICIALIIKMIFIYEQSKFDGSHSFILAIVSQKSVREVVAFHPEIPATSTLLIQDNTVSYDTLAQKFGIPTDGYIIIPQGTAVSSDMTKMMWSSLLNSPGWQSNLTIIDKLRLILLAKSVVANNKNIEQISLNKQTPDTNTIISTALTDQDLSTENISIQIINATGVPGLGQRLGRVLTNMGANVVDVSSAENPQAKSSIAYFGNESYTSDRLQKIFGVSATKLDKQTIADIIIIIGNDKRNTKEF